MGHYDWLLFDLSQGFRQPQAGLDLDINWRTINLELLIYLLPKVAVVYTTMPTCLDFKVS